MSGWWPWSSSSHIVQEESEKGGSNRRIGTSTLSSSVTLVLNYSTQDKLHLSDQFINQPLILWAALSTVCVFTILLMHFNDRFPPLAEIKSVLSIFCCDTVVGLYSVFRVSVRVKVSCSTSAHHRSPLQLLCHCVLVLGTGKQGFLCVWGLTKQSKHVAQPAALCHCRCH